MTLPVWLPCLHHYRHFTFPWGSHRWPSDHAPRWSDHARNRGWWSDCEPRQSDRPRNRGWWSGGQTAHPHTSPSSPASPTTAAPRPVPTTSVAPNAVHMTPPVPRVVLTSRTPPASPVASCHPRATWEPPTPPLHQQSSPTKAIPVAPLINPHPRTTRVNQSFRLSADKLMSSATSLSPLSLGPTSIHTALTDPSWRCAMEEEYDALITNNTWDLVPRHVGSNVVTGKWIFKHKFNSGGTLEQYKAHWVLRGFTQQPDINYDETFSPVVKLTIVRTMLSLVVSRSWHVH
jgi:hypothetical protein